MSRMRPPLTTSMTGPRTTPSASLMASMLPHARSYWARFLDRMRRPSLSSFWSTRASIWSPTLTTSWGSTSWRMDSSRTGITPSDLKPMSRRTSSLSTLTTVPWTMSPSSNSTMVPAMASSREVSPRSLTTTCWGTYSPSSSKPPGGVEASGASGVMVGVTSDIGGGLSFGDALPAGQALAGRAFMLHRRFLCQYQPLRVLEVGRAGGVAAGGDRPQAPHLEAGPGGDEAQLARREAGRPQVELGGGAPGVEHRGPFVVDPGVGVEGVAFFEVAHGEVGGEGGEGQAAAGPQDAGHLPYHQGVVIAPEQAETPLADADGGVEAARGKGEAPGVGARPRAGAGRRQEGVGEVGADRPQSGSGQPPPVAPGPAPHVEHPGAGGQPEGLH